jgi:hypothetical protein
LANSSSSPRGATASPQPRQRSGRYNQTSSKSESRHPTVCHSEVSAKRAAEESRQRRKTRASLQHSNFAAAWPRHANAEATFDLFPLPRFFSFASLASE